jgi:sulfur-oxidizing protein SoxY
MNRRDGLLLLGSGMIIAMVARPLNASDDDVAAAIRDQFGKRPRSRGRITLKLPKLAESGNSVPIAITIESPMSSTDRVLRACIFATRNPRPLIASIAFGPRAATAALTTNMRLNGTQDVVAVAEMSDQSLWSAEARVLVTVGACDALQAR